MNYGIFGIVDYDLSLIVNSITLITMARIMHGGCYAAMVMQVDGAQNFVIAWKITAQDGDTMMPVLIN